MPAMDCSSSIGTAKTNHLCCGLSTHSGVRFAVVPLSGGVRIGCRFSRCKHTRKVRKLCTPPALREKHPVLNKARPSPPVVERLPPEAPRGTHRGAHRRSPLSPGENRPMRKCLAVLGKTRRPTASARIAPTLTNWAIYLEGKGFGSSGRTRTYNPSVNSRMLYH